jgi:Retroviral aspartyl protease
MLFHGSWSQCEDGVMRPVVRGLVQTAGGDWTAVDFLVDTGADRTTFITPVLIDLNLPAVGSRDHLTGLGGVTPSVQIATSIRFQAEDGSMLRFQGHFTALTDAKALDMSVLGRDILDTLVLIVDWRARRVCLLGDGHRYTIDGS